MQTQTSKPTPRKLTAEQQQYLLIRKRSIAESDKIFDAAVAESLRKAGIAQPTGQDWVKFAAAQTFKCGQCAGTGQFITMVVNNKPTGPGGECYRCAGKGVQDDEDARRNWGYDNNRTIHI